MFVPRALKNTHVAALVLQGAFLFLVFEAIMAKKIAGMLKLQIAAGQANPSPPVGPALGQRGVNIMEFCKAFNAATQSLEPGAPVPVVLTIYTDKSFTFITKTPPATHLLLKAAGKKKGAANTGAETIGTVSREDVKNIAQIKMKDLNATDIDNAMRIIEGSARSIGLEVTE